MADKIRVGMVGASVNAGGGWAPRAHIPALQALPDYEIVAVCTTNVASAEASAKAFGARLAFHDVSEMAAHPDVDLVVVSLKVPNHRAPVMAAIAAGKDTFCEWPLGADLAEAEEMAGAARNKGVRTIVGLQGRSDPAFMYAREMVAKGEIGEVLNAHLVVFSPAPVERGVERSWSAKASAGANTLTIAGGHAIDALAFVAGEFTEVSARVSTRVKQWKLSDGTSVDVDAPDSIAFSGKLAGGAEVAGTIVALPSARNETRLLIFGSEGSLTVIPGMNANIGPNAVFLGRGSEAPQEVPVPDRFKLAPEGTPPGPPYNVAQAYARYADAKAAGQPFDVDFGAAVRRHALLDAMERSSAEGKTITLS